VPLPRQERGRHGGIDAAGHGYNYSHKTMNYLRIPVTVRSLPTTCGSLSRK
jgi:hypothetical protein